MSTVGLRYRMRRGDFGLDVEVELAMRGITGIFGESGAGKTSLLRCIAGLEKPDEGRLAVAGETWQDSESGLDRPAHERAIGYVFQEPRLFPHLSVRGNLDYAMRRRRPPDGTLERVVDLLGLARMLERSPASLSGGEAQRVAIARALVCRPRFVLMDEPLASLDRQRKADILPFLDRLHAELDVPVFYVSHSIGEISRLCDQLVVMEAGRIAASGAISAVLARTDLPLLAGEEAGVVVDGTVQACDEEFGLSIVTTPAGTLRVAGRYGPGGACRIRIRAGDVSLALVEPQQTSILNVLPAVVDRVQEEGDSTVLVRLSSGSETLLARVTRRSAALLGLAPGLSVYAQIKSVAVKNAPQ